MYTMMAMAQPVPPAGADPMAAVTLATIPTITMPTYIALGVAFNQLGTPRVNAFFSGIVPVSSQQGVYESTTADIIPVTKTDSVTGRRVYTMSAQLREGVHKTIYTGQRVQFMFGGDVGGSFTSASTGVTIGLAAAVTGTVAYQLSAHWGVMVPIRALYTPSIGGWNFIPQIALVWKP